MKTELRRSARRMQDILASLGTACEVVELPASTRTAVDAATAIGCTVEQIAKSLVFRTVKEQKPILVIASGVNRVNEKRIADHVGEAIEKADAAYVRAKTGFVIGGVPPVGHGEPMVTVIDEDLLTLGDIWAAGGHSERGVQAQCGQLGGADRWNSDGDSMTCKDAAYSAMSPLAAHGILSAQRLCIGIVRLPMHPVLPCEVCFAPIEGAHETIATSDVDAITLS